MLELPAFSTTENKLHLSVEWEVYTCLLNEKLFQELLQGNITNFKFFLAITFEREMLESHNF